MFSWPSPGPIDFWTGSLGGLSPLPLALLPPPLSLLLAARRDAERRDAGDHRRPQAFRTHASS